MDSLSKEQRSILMGHIKSGDTKPELYVRSLLHRSGYRYRLHVRDLPGKPDIVLPRYKTVIEVRGCFWHLHKNCNHARIPKTRSSWWANKLEKNVERDQSHCAILKTQGWRIIVIWCCIFKKIPEGFKSYFAERLIAMLDLAIKNVTTDFIEIDRDLLFHNDIPTGGVIWNR